MNDIDQAKASTPARTEALAAELDAATSELRDLRAEFAKLRAEIERGLRFTHVMMTRNQAAVRDAAATLNGLGHVLAASGQIDTERVQQARDDYARAEPRPTFRARVGPDIDKYSEKAGTVTIDCAARLPLCKAACCRLGFVLGTQDLDEAIVQWTYGDPYVIRRKPSGWCTHLGSDCACTVHAQRPLACRTYDCSNNPDIWIDFDRRVPNPAVGELPENT